MEAEGSTVEYEQLEGPRLLDALFDKLEEEISELRRGGSIGLEELADAREVIDAIALQIGHRKVELDALQFDKHRRLGGFAAGEFVHTETLSADKPRAEYYAADSKRFPEIVSEEQ